MQIIYPIDKLFIAIYSSLILGVSLIFTFETSSILFLAVAIPIEIIYLYFSLKGPFHRLHALKNPIPGQWKSLLLEYSRFYRNLDAPGKKQFENDVLIFLSDFTIEGIRRHPVDIKTKLLVAAGFATALFGQPGWEPPIKDGVIIYPGNRFNRDFEIGRGNFAGMATARSPLIVTGDSLEHSFLDPDDGYNVIIHELGHYFDMEDGVADGIPSSRLSPDLITPWKTIINDEWQKALNGNSFLNPYSGLNEAELFAVAVEYFFENPRLIFDNNPALYRILEDFFNCHPLEILEGN